MKAIRIAALVWGTGLSMAVAHPGHDESAAA
jgi:hypothetical protein